MRGYVAFLNRSVSDELCFCARENCSLGCRLERSSGRFLS